MQSLDYSKVPSNFVHCLNKECPKADNCLRFQVTQYLPATRRDFRVLNPVYMAQMNACTEYVSDTPQRYAYGWTHMFDKLAYEKAIAIKHDLLDRYGKTLFYRLKRKEKSFTPDMQEFVRHTFKQHGVTEEPVYDFYQDDYVWQR